MKLDALYVVGKVELSVNGVCYGHPETVRIKVGELTARCKLDVAAMSAADESDAALVTKLATAELGDSIARALKGATGEEVSAALVRLIDRKQGGPPTLAETPPDGGGELG